MKTFRKRFLSAICLVAFGVSVAFAQTNTIKHTVERGETLKSIAKRYSTTEEKIIELNPDAAQFVYVGMDLTIPKEEEKVEEVSKIIQTDKDVFVDKGKSLLVGYNNVSSTNNNDIKGEGYDCFFEYAPNSKVYGFGIDRDINKFLFGHFGMCSNLKFGKNDFSTILGIIGFGLQQRFLCYNDNIMLCIKACPYGGLSGYDRLNDKQAKDSKTKLTYGAKAEASLGVKLFTNNNGHDVYLTAGYSILAEEFKTKGMFDSGMIMFGYSIIF